MGRMPNGDFAKPASGYSDSNQDDLFDDKPCYLTLNQALEMWSSNLAKQGWFLVPQPDGDVAGYAVYRGVRPSLLGLEPPKSFTQLKRFHPYEKAKFNAWEEAVTEAMQDLTEDKSEAEVKTHQKIFKTLTDGFHDPRSSIAGLNRQLARQVVKPPTFTGLTGCYKYVPCLEWFPEPIRNLSRDELDLLLSLFPPSEKRQFRLLLGRILAGAKNEETAEGFLVQHTARSFAIIVGREPGLGKSTMLEYIEKTLQALGYSVAGIDPSFGKFGWGEVAVSDLATIDDLVDDNQKAFITSKQVKSIVSNNKLRTEDKGVSGVMTQARSVLIGCSNSTNYAHYFDADPGILNRLNQLDTYITPELKQYVQGRKIGSYVITDARIKPLWEGLARHYGVSVETLVARLFRSCLDEFLETTGHYYEGGVLYHNPDRDRLQSVMEANREGFRIDVSLKHVEELVRVAADLTALAISYHKYPERLLDRVQYLDFNATLVTAVAGTFLYRDLPEPFDRLQLKELSADCRLYLEPKVKEMLGLNQHLSATKAFSTVIDEYKSRKGFKYPSSAMTYTGFWESERRRIPSLVEFWQKQEVPECLDKVLTHLARRVSEL